MSITKKFAKVFGTILLLTGIILLVMTIIYTDDSFWLSNVFHDKVYIYQWSVLYMAGVIYLDKFMTTPVLTRIGSRKRAAFVLLGIKFGFAFTYLCIVFSLIGMLAIIKCSHIPEKTTAEILGIFVHYFMGFLLLSVFAEIFRRSENKFLSGNAHLCTILVLVLEQIIIVPQIMKYTPFKLYFIFSWIFYDGIAGYAALSAILICALLYLFKVGIRKDIL